jgi:hypothetical protein
MYRSASSKVSVSAAPVGAVPTANAAVLVNRVEKLLRPIKVDPVLDGDEHRPLVELGAKVFDDCRHPTVIPWAHVSGRVWQPSNESDRGRCHDSEASPQPRM